MDSFDAQKMENDNFHSMQYYSMMKSQNNDNRRSNRNLDSSNKKDRSFSQIGSSYKTAVCQDHFDIESQNASSLKSNLIEDNEDSRIENQLTFKKIYSAEARQSIDTMAQSSVTRSMQDTGVGLQNQSKSTKVKCNKCEFEAYTEVTSHLRTKGRIFVTLLTLTLMWPCAICLYKSPKYRYFIHECSSCGRNINDKCNE